MNEIKSPKKVVGRKFIFPFGEKTHEQKSKGERREKEVFHNIK